METKKENVHAAHIKEEKQKEKTPVMPKILSLTGKLIAIQY